jgi:hypothetical protein
VVWILPAFHNLRKSGCLWVAWLGGGIFTDLCNRNPIFHIGPVSIELIHRWIQKGLQRYESSLSENRQVLTYWWSFDCIDLRNWQNEEGGKSEQKYMRTWRGFLSLRGWDGLYPLPLSSCRLERALRVDKRQLEYSLVNARSQMKFLENIELLFNSRWEGLQRRVLNDTRARLVRFFV